MHLGYPVCNSALKHYIVSVWVSVAPKCILWRCASWSRARTIYRVKTYGPIHCRVNATNIHFVAVGVGTINVSLYTPGIGVRITSSPYMAVSWRYGCRHVDVKVIVCFHNPDVGLSSC